SAAPVGRIKLGTESNGGSRFWEPDINGSGGYIFDDRDGSLNLYQHIFSPEEVGGANNYTTHSRSYNFAFGVRGTFGSSDWDYDAFYSRSQYNIKDSQLWPLTDEIEDFFRDQFLGPQLDTYYGYPVYHPDMAGFYQSLTPEQYASFLGEIKTDSTTWTHNVNFQVTNTSLFTLPAGDVGVAALAQFGRQSWSNPTDQRVIAGDFWGITGTQGEGERSNAAVGVEFRVPLFTMLTASVSGRYDTYKNIDAGDDAKATWKLGLEFRPIETLLIRGNYATAFRAPDMSYVFAGDSGFFTTATDYFKCEEAGQDVDDCDFGGVQVQGRRSGNPDLKSITADSWGYGFVWSPNRKFDLRADYYNVKIDNEVNDRPLSDILQIENECRQGRLDANSPDCLSVLGLVERNGPNAPIPYAITLIHTSPVNITSEKVAGIIAGTTYRWGGGRQGNFELSLDYNTTLDHRSTLFPGSPEVDYLRQPKESFSSEFKEVLTGDFNWDIGKWSTNIHGVRYGSSPDLESQNTLGLNRRVAPWVLFNLNIGYDLTKNSNLSLTVNNVGNRKPPFDRTYNAYPYYNVFNYNGYGRSWFVQYNFDFGASED
ncbi:MAG: TonB-dependent receptor, partial [Arenimonas sp.]